MFSARLSVAMGEATSCGVGKVKTRVSTLVLTKQLFCEPQEYGDTMCYRNQDKGEDKCGGGKRESWWGMGRSGGTD
ncbi:hypothetical protein FRC08_000696 [Ceratobasidium sp. 394]|nr:hypothetical protein FRC08_000696 [Ceratobasidium sp. 394]